MNFMQELYTGTEETLQELTKISADARVMRQNATDKPIADMTDAEWSDWLEAALENYKALQNLKLF